MRIPSSFILRVLQMATVVGVSVVAAACDSPIGPTAEHAVTGPAAAGSPPTGTVTPAPATNLRRAPVDLGRCLAGDGSPSCFDARALRSATVAVNPATAPGAPTNLTCTVSGSTVSLSWTASVGGDPVIGYRLQAGSAFGLSNYADFFTGSTAASYVAFDVLPGGPNFPYYVRVLGVAAGQGNVSGPSNEVRVIVGEGAGCTPLGSTPTPPSCPTAPQTLLNASQSAGTISLIWAAPASGAPTSYVIVAGSAPGRSDLANFDTGSTALSYLATDVPAGSYYVRVFAKSSCGLSSASNEVLVFVIAFSGDVQVSVSWDSPTDVDLHVVDPSGEEIYYGHRTSLSGGQLDVDSNPACNIDGRQIENIAWGSRAPAGTYTVRVDYYNDCGVTRTNYLVTVKNGGSRQTFSGNFTGQGDRAGFGGGRQITTFSHAASLVRDSVFELIRPPELFVPNAEKLRLSGGSR